MKNVSKSRKTHVKMSSNGKWHGRFLFFFIFCSFTSRSLLVEKKIWDWIRIAFFFNARLPLIGLALSWWLLWFYWVSMGFYCVLLDGNGFYWVFLEWKAAQGRRSGRATGWGRRLYRTDGLADRPISDVNVRGAHVLVNFVFSCGHATL